MSKIELSNIASGYDLSKVNANFQKIEDELNNKVLYRDVIEGEPNTLESDVDANGSTLYNVRDAVLNTEVVPLGQLNNILAETTFQEPPVVPKREDFIATNGQTVFVLSDVEYIPGTDSLKVYKEGSLLTVGVDYTETSETSFTLLSGATLGDNVSAITYGVVTPISDLTLLTKFNQYEAKYADITQYGASPSASATINSAAIQECINENSRIFIPAGEYKINGTITVGSNKIVFGEGNSSILKLDSSVGDSGWGLKIVDASNTVIRDLKVDGYSTRKFVVQSGTITTSTSSHIVSGSGTSFTDLSVGTTLVDSSNNLIGIIKSISSDISLTLGFNGINTNANVALSSQQYKAHDFSIANDPEGSGIIVQDSEHIKIENVTSVNWAKHCIDVTADEYTTGNPEEHVEGSRSMYVDIVGCYASGAGDDNITTHQSDFINIVNCVSESPSGYYVSTNTNCIEIDDGSRYVNVTGCTSVDGITGIQVKGHSDSAAPQHVVLSNNFIKECNYGIDAYNTGFYGTRSTATLGANPFTSVSGSNLVQVTHVGHGGAEGDFVTLSGATTFAGIPVYALGGKFRIAEVVNTDNYKIRVSVSATSSTTGGGSAVEAIYSGDFSTTAYGLSVQDCTVVNPTVAKNVGVTEEVPFFARVRSYSNVSIDGINCMDGSSTYEYGAVAIVAGVRSASLANISFRNASYLHGVRITGSCYDVTADHITAIDCTGDSLGGLIYFTRTPDIKVKDVFSFNTTGPKIVDSQRSLTSDNCSIETNQIQAVSSGDATTTPQTVVSYGWVEGDQDLGEGEGCAVAFTASLSSDEAPYPVVSFGSYKASNSDATRTSYAYIATSSDGIATPTPRVRIGVSDAAMLTPWVNNTYTLGSTSFRWSGLYATELNIGTGSVKIVTGSGTPEGNVTAAIGSLYTDATNGVAYMKKSGTGNTGWKLITQAA